MSAVPASVHDSYHAQGEKMSGIERELNAGLLRGSQVLYKRATLALETPPQKDVIQASFRARVQQ